MDVYCVSRFRYFEDSEKLHWHQSQLENENQTYKFLNSIMPDIILHLAGVHGPSNKIAEIAKTSSIEMLHIHVTVTQHLINWCEVHPKTKLFIPLSSKMYSVRGRKRIINSKSEINPDSFYGETKAMAFKKIQDAQSNGLLVFGAILFTHSSPFSKQGFLLYDVAQQILANSHGKELSISLLNAFDHIDISDARDVCLAIGELLNQNHQSNTVIGAGKSQIISEIVLESLEILGIEKMEISSISKNKSFGLVADSEEMKRVIPKWPGSRPITRTLVDVINYLKNGNRDH